MSSTKQTRQNKFYSMIPRPTWATESTSPRAIRRAAREYAALRLRRVAEGRGVIQWGEAGDLARLFWRREDGPPLRLVEGVAGPLAPLP